jgi:enamine deaminase RidA (YjgF/YER057c/UK114 family)
MTRELINPDDVATPSGYTHVIAATGSRLVFVAGQVAEDEQGNLVGPGDLTAQARQAFANLARCLRAGGARPDQVTKLTIYVVDYRKEYWPAICAARDAVFGEHQPTDTLLGIEALAEPQYMIEIDAIAVVD